MINQNRPSYNTVPHYIARERRSGELNINQFRLLMWLRAIGTPYGIATTSLVDLKNDVFPDFDLKINTINSMLLKLRQKQHIFYEPRQGKIGTFEIQLNHWFMPKKQYKTLDKFFSEPKQWLNVGEEVAGNAPFPQPNQSEVSQMSEAENQKLLETKDQVVKRFSTNSVRREIRSSHNEHDTEKENKNYDTLEKTFKGTLIKDFNPNSYEEERCKEIALQLGDEYINTLLSVLRNDGFQRVEQAWGIFREHKSEGKKMDNPARYFMGIIKTLRKA